MRQLFTISFTFLFLFFIFSKAVVSQEIPPKWQLGIHGGPTLFWGDLSVNEDEGDYLAKFKDDNQWSFGLNAGYRILPFALLGGDFSYGQLEGMRDTYDDPNSLMNQTFETEYFDYALSLRLNLNDLIGGYRSDRLLSVYLLGGYGQLHYRAKTSQLNSGAILNTVGYSNNGQTKEDMQTAWRIPVGGGLQFRLSERFEASLQTYVNYTDVDDLDATVGSTDVNDQYSYTSVGVAYNFGTKKKPKPQYPPDPEPEPEPEITEAVEEIHEVDVDFTSNLPKTVRPDTTLRLTYRLKKGDLEEYARFEQTFPQGVKVMSGKAAGAKFSFKDQLMVFEWDQLPKASSIKLSAQLKVQSEIVPQHYDVPGRFNYQENGEEKRKVFAMGFLAKPKKVVEVAEPEPEKSGSEIVYRVQVRAIYNGKQSTSEVKQVYKLDKNVYEHFHQGYAKYSAGDFDNYSQANEYKRVLRNEKGVNGAFVVAFHNKERLNSLSDVDRVLNQGAKAEVKTGTYYKIQIAAVSAGNNRTAVAVFRDKYNLAGEDIRIETSGNWHRYTIGSYADYNQAKQKLSDIRQRVPDAFIARYQDGRRM
ncbi:MAG: SPOR domain-containing protein [Bacteroidales bacterium]